MPDEPANLIAAACAAASWARARRATWTALPLTAHTMPREDLTLTEDLNLTEAISLTSAPGLPAPSPPFLSSLDTGPSVAARAADLMRSVGARVKRWLPLVLAVTALLGAGVAGGRYVWTASGRYLSREPETSPARSAGLKPVPVHPPATSHKE